MNQDEKTLIASIESLIFNYMKVQNVEIDNEQVNDEILNRIDDLINFVSSDNNKMMYKVLFVDVSKIKAYDFANK